MSELLPCPHCGGEAHIAENVGYRGDIAYTVNCNAVYGCIASDSGLWYSSREAAVEAWNTRADDYRQAAEYWRRMYEEAFAERTCECVAEYVKSPIDGKTIVLHRCSACHELMRPHMAYCPNCGARVIKSDQDLAQEVNE